MPNFESITIIYWNAVLIDIGDGYNNVDDHLISEFTIFLNLFLQGWDLDLILVFQ